MPKSPRDLEQQTGLTAGLGLDQEKINVLRRLGATILVLALIAIFARSTFSVAYGQKRAWVWGVFHYYLGAKYFPELGYTNLYPCALQADQESNGPWYVISGARDMHTYRIVPQASLPPCPRANFSPERWSEFSQDVEYFAHLASPIYFAQVFTDKGLNPPPSWVAIARPLAQVVPLSKRGLATIVFNLDIAAVLIGIVLIYRSGSGLAALVTAGLMVLYFGTFGLIAGNFLQYLWFPLLIAAVLLWQQGKAALSGAALGVAAGLQVFPLFFGIPIVVRGVAEFLFQRRKKRWHSHFSFSCGLLLVVVAAFLLGCSAGRGVRVWGEWENKISVHKRYLQGEIFNIGLVNLTATAVSGVNETPPSYVEDTDNTFMRLEFLERNRWIFYAVSAVVLAIWLFITLRAPASDLFGHGFLILYTLVNLSPYYYLSLAVLPLMFWKSNRLLRMYAAWATIALITAHAVLFRGVYASFRYAPLLWSKCSIAAFFFGLAAVSIYSNRMPGEPDRADIGELQAARLKST